MIPESRPNIGRQLGISTRNAYLLLLKVVEEFGDLRQFTQTGRFGDLLHKGVGQLRSIMEPVSESTEAVEQQIIAHLEEKDLEGDRCFYTPDLPVAAIVYNPVDTRIRYCRSERSDYVAPAHFEGKWKMTSITGSLDVNRAYTYPQLGYKDSEGIKTLFFRKNSTNDSLGGIKIDNRESSIKILNYEELMAEVKHSLNPDEAVMMANWYMDSDNQNVVSKCETDIVPFNGMGVMQNHQSNQQLFFSINSGGMSYLRIGEMFSLKTMWPRPRTKRTVAAMCNLLAKKCRCESWRICGVDYNNGGTFPFNLGPNREFFGIYRDRTD